MNVYMVTMKFAVQTEHTAAELLAMDPYQIEQESMSVPDVQVTEMVEKDPRDATAWGLRKSGRTAIEIADLLGINVATVYRRISREKADSCAESARDVRDALTFLDDGSVHDVSETMTIQLLERAAERLETRSPVGVQS